MILSNWLERIAQLVNGCWLVLLAVCLFKYFLRQIRNYIFSGYIIREVQEWPNMLWFYVCNSDLEFMITNKLKKSNENNKPTCISGLLLKPDPDGKDVSSP
jgi:hypothetical protein